MKDFGKRGWLAVVTGLVLSSFVLTSGVRAQDDDEPDKIDLNGFWMDSRENGAIRIVHNENDVTGYLLEPFICGAASTNISFTATLKGNKLTGETNTCYRDKDSNRSLKMARMKMDVVVNGTLLVGYWPDDQGRFQVIQISRETLRITELKLTELRRGRPDDKRIPLEYLSVGAHPYDNTEVYGAVTVEGDPMDELTELVLEVIEGPVVRGTAVKAVANLATNAKTALFQPFGNDRKVSIGLPDNTNQIGELLFELPSAEAARINTTINGTVRLRVRAKTKWGEQVTKEFSADGGNVQGVHKLVRYAGNNRYAPFGANDLPGGDDWVKPSVKVVTEYFSQLAGHPAINWGDFSNMNGGSFRPHLSHQTGNDFDGHWIGYNVRDDATARQMIAFLNNPTYGRRIEKVWVMYRAGAGNAGPVTHQEFWNVISDTELDVAVHPDPRNPRRGKLASDVISSEADHDTHFHWRILDE